MVRGLERLRLPNLLVQIMGFMVRYLEVVGDDLRRQQIALASRGFSARDPAALAGPRPLRRRAVHPHATSAANASTSPCSPAATPAGCRKVRLAHAPAS